MLEVDSVVEAGVLNNVSFKAYGGQILGFAGLVGAGRTEIMRAIFGADPIDSGKIKIKGKEVSYQVSASGYQAWHRVPHRGP